MINEEAFRLWLQENTTMSMRAVKDVASRLKRSENYVDVDGAGNAKGLVSQMDNNPDFSALSITVKSQLRRAIRLYKQYKDE